MSATRLEDYKVDSAFCKELGLVIEDDGDEDMSFNALVNNAWQLLLTRIYDSNDSIVHTKAALFDYLSDDENEDSEDKIDGFKFAQFQVITALINNVVNPITAEIDATLSGRCGLIKRNGYQKN